MCWALDEALVRLLLLGLTCRGDEEGKGKGRAEERVAGGWELTSAQMTLTGSAKELRTLKKDTALQAALLCFHCSAKPAPRWSSAVSASSNMRIEGGNEEGDRKGRSKSSSLMARSPPDDSPQSSREVCFSAEDDTGKGCSDIVCYSAASVLKTKLFLSC